MRARLRAVAGGGGAERRLTDEELVRAVQRGDDQISAELYDRLVGVVDQTLYRVFGRREPDHEDLMQAAFEQIVLTLARQSFAGACSLKTWASRITGHVGLNALRARRRERQVLVGADEEMADPADGPPSSQSLERQTAARVELERIRVQLSQMKPHYSETVLLHDVLGHDLAEIAVMMGVSVAAAQSRLVRGRRELQRRYQDALSRRAAEVER